MLLLAQGECRRGVFINTRSFMAPRGYVPVRPIVVSYTLFMFIYELFTMFGGLMLRAY